MRSTYDIADFIAMHVLSMLRNHHILLKSELICWKFHENIFISVKVVMKNLCLPWSEMHPVFMIKKIVITLSYVNMVLIDVFLLQVHKWSSETLCVFTSPPTYDFLLLFCFVFFSLIKSVFEILYFHYAKFILIFYCLFLAFKYLSTCFFPSFFKISFLIYIFLFMLNCF